MSNCVKKCTLALSILSVSVLTLSNSQAAGMDQKVLSNLHHGNQSEIHMAQIALRNAESHEVTSYASQLITDHTAADKKVLDLAKEDGIALKPISESKSDIAHLESLRGSEFDNEYSKMMVADHRRDIAELVKALPKVEHANIRAFGEDLLVTFNHHQQMAAKIEAGQTENAPA